MAILNTHLLQVFGCFKIYEFTCQQSYTVVLYSYRLKQRPLSTSINNLESLGHFLGYEMEQRKTFFYFRFELSPDGSPKFILNLNFFYIILREMIYICVDILCIGKIDTIPIYVHFLFPYFPWFFCFHFLFNIIFLESSIYGCDLLLYMVGKSSTQTKYLLQYADREHILPSVRISTCDNLNLLLIIKTTDMFIRTDVCFRPMLLPHIFMPV